MSEVIEVRWHGRGGQGAKTGSAILAEVLFEAGKFTQSFPEYGAERQGAPMKAFNRVSSKPIRVRSGVLQPDIVVLIDPTLIDAVKPTEGGKNDTVYIINTPDSPASVRGKLGIPASATLMTVDEAVDHMELVGHDFFLFVDAATDRPSVGYRRTGWNYGVISLETEAEVPVKARRRG